MRKHRAMNWGLALFIVACMGFVQHLDSKAEEKSSLALQDAISQQRMDLRFAKAAQEMCGIGQPWRVTEDGALSCLKVAKKGAL